VATETAKQLGDRFRNIRQAWDLRADETEVQAQNKALVPLRDWLLKGVTSAEIPLRAAQVLMADPERPGIHKRPAVNAVLTQVSDAWESAGLKERDVQILRGMLLATWPQGQQGGGFALAPLLDSAWMAITSRTIKDKALQDWRRQLLATTAQPLPVSKTKKKPAEESNLSQELTSFEFPDLTKAIKVVETAGAPYSEKLATQTARAFSSFVESIEALTAHLNTTVTTSIAELDIGVSNLSSQISEATTQPKSQTEQLNLLWWGQARYSHYLQTPYRHFSDVTERLWWMAWDCSELAQSLQVEPAASFLVETLYQVDRTIDTQKRPLAAWVAELTGTLRRIREQGQHAPVLAMGKHLEKFAQEDPLGLPVTWARLEAARAKPSQDAIEDQLRVQVGLDPQVLLDRGDWAAWVFREALLDRRLGGQ
jgi:hypothetical protein